MIYFELLCQNYSNLVQWFIFRSFNSCHSIMSEPINCINQELSLNIGEEDEQSADQTTFTF